MIVSRSVRKARISALSLSCFALTSPVSIAADDPATALSWSAYLEPYITVESPRPADDQRPGFLYSHDRSSRLALNLAMLRVAGEGARFRGGAAVAAGTYMSANYAAEPQGFRQVFEAWGGIALMPEGRLWLDAGVFPSHIGFESAIGTDNWALTRSLAADNSPYFETGVRLAWRSEEGRLSAAALLLNGWQRIRQPSGHAFPTFGHQLTWTPHERITVNGSSFIGTDKPRSESRRRVFHDLYVITRLGGRWSLAAGLDIGSEEATPRGGRSNRWSSQQVLLRRDLDERTAVTWRLERFRDRGGVIASLGGRGLDTSGTSVSVDRRMGRYATWRTELRLLRDPATAFVGRDGSRHAVSSSLTSSLALDLGARAR